MVSGKEQRRFALSQSVEMAALRRFSRADNVEIPRSVRFKSKYALWATLAKYSAGLSPDG